MIHRKVFQTVAFIVVGLFALCVFAGDKDLANEKRSKLKLALDESGLSGQMVDLSNSYNGAEISDDVFENVDTGNFSTLAAEEFEVDSEKEEEIEDFWNFALGKSENWEYQVRYEEDALMLRNTSKTYSDGKVDMEVAAADIEDVVKADLATLGLQEKVINQDLDIQVIRLLRKTINSDDGVLTSEAVAYKVHVHRKIGGLNVRGARILLSYFMDGTLQKVSMKWPKILGHTIEVPKWSEEQEEAILDAAMAEIVPGTNMYKYIEDVDARLGLEIEDGYIKPIVIFRLTEKPYHTSNSIYQEEIVIRL